MKKAIQVGSVNLPLDYVTQTGAILAVRGAGKSNLATTIAEDMHAAGLQWVAIDPVGAWRGVRSGPDGKPGLPVVIFGGQDADVPLERTGGKLIADVVVQQGLTCVLDVSELSEGDKTKFLIDFAERVYKTNRAPLHLFLEEADDYIPQKPFREQARLLHAWEQIVRRGRSRGLGCTLITQRSAVVNKNVLTQIETLFVLRTTSPQDKKAIEAWVALHGAEQAMLDSLPTLASGECWVWSPAWLGVFERVKVRRRWTLDTGATPTGGGKKRQPATRAQVDLGVIRTAMAETIERAKGEDPAELRKKVAELERALVAAKKATPAAAPVPPVEVRVPLFTADELGRVEGIADRLEADAAFINTLVRRGRTELALRPLAPARAEMSTSAHRPPATARPSSRPAAAPRGNGPGEKLSKCERGLLTALAQHGPLSLTQAAMIAGYSTTSSTPSNAASALRADGYLSGSNAEMQITDGGEAALGAWSPLPVGQALAEYWYGQIGKCEREILAELVKAHPEQLSLLDVATRTGYSTTSSTPSNAASKLRSLKLVEGSNAGMRAAERLVGVA